ncbi:MAG: saccharopine dehydrogenase NADP-binding domain-containing protein [Polyangiaceae bacterium]
MDRTYDLVLFGATGYTGKLVAEYLAKHARGLVWAVAGRNADKLREVIASLGDKGKSVGLFVVDSSDEAGLDALAQKTRVVVTTVGPYALLGRPLARVCARRGTHYADLTGEVPFIRASIDDNHEAAKASGARIVHSCGFDSIPSDLGVLILAEAAKARGETLGKTRLVVLRAKGGFSGGTAASLLNVLAEAEKDRGLRRMLADPYSLTPDAAAEIAVDRKDAFKVAFDEDAKGYTAPFIMAAINTRVVRRSNALAKHAYGKQFSYDEAMSFSKGPKGLAMASAVTAAIATTMVLGANARTRTLLEKLFPTPGEGPTKAERDAGFFRIGLYTTTSSGRKLEARVEGTSDPGYGETAKMLSESALALVEGAFASPEGGVLTPAYALGMPLVERLRRAGMTFDVL